MSSTTANIDFSACEADTTGNAFKDLGNKLLAERKYDDAIECYTRAIACDPQNHFFYSNRSAAYMYMLDGQKALEDAEQCIRVSPDFPKGYSRKAAALLHMNEFSLCLEACYEGQRVTKGSERMIVDLIKQCKKSFVLKQLMGRSFGGAVAQELGGYTQVFEFTTDSSMKIHAMGRAIDGTYTINVEQKPMHLNVSTLLPETNQVAADVPYIMEFERDVLGELMAGVSKDAPAKKKEKKTRKQRREEKQKLTESQQQAGGEVENVDGEEKEAENIDDVLINELRLCCPYMTADRPKTFTGPGYCVIKVITEGSPEAAELAHARGDRVVPEEIAAMSADEQLLHFAENMLALLPEQRLPEPSENDAPPVAAAKYSQIVKLHNAMMAMDCRYPEDISTSIQKMCDGEIEATFDKLKAAVNKLRNRMRLLGFIQDPEEQQKQQEEFQQKIAAAAAANANNKGNKMFNEAVNKMNKENNNKKNNTNTPNTKTSTNEKKPAAEKKTNNNNNNQTSNNTSAPQTESFLTKATNFLTSPPGMISIAAAAAAVAILVASSRK